MYTRCECMNIRVSYNILFVKVVALKRAGVFVSSSFSFYHSKPLKSTSNISSISSTTAESLSSPVVALLAPVAVAADDAAVLLRILAQMACCSQ